MINNKFNSLKDLPELQPDYLWVQKTKYSLLSEIKTQNRIKQAERLTTKEKFGMLSMSFGVKMAASASRLVAMFLVVSLGSGLSMAAQASVPGEMLWPVKRSLEKAEVTLTLSPVKETEIHLKHVDNRLNEIEKILNEDDAQDSAKKEKAVKQAIKHLEKDVVAADTSLKVAKEEKDPMAVVVLAEKVTHAAKETASNLEIKSNNASDQIIGDALGSAIKVNAEAKTSAVSLALDVHEQVVAEAVKQDANQTLTINATSSSAQLSANNPKIQELKNVTEVIIKILDSEIKDLSSEVQVTKDKVEKVESADTKSELDIKNIKVDGKIISGTDALKNSGQVAADGLSQAKDLLDKGALKDSLDKIAEVKVATKNTETVLKQIQAIANGVTATGPATSTNNNTGTKPNTSTTPVTASTTGSTVIKSDGGEPVLPDSSLDIKAEDGIQPEDILFENPIIIN